MKFEANTITVLHTAYCVDKVGVRIIPQHIPSGSRLQDFAEMAFEHTNQPEPRTLTHKIYGRCYSVSVGDCVVVSDENERVSAFICNSCGWTRVALVELYELFFQWSLFSNEKGESHDSRGFWRDKGWKDAKAMV